MRTPSINAQDNKSNQAEADEKPQQSSGVNPRPALEQSLLEGEAVISGTVPTDEQRQQHVHEHHPQIEALQKKRFNTVVFRFLASWIAFLGVLVIVALLSNLEWARPKIERAMSDSFGHRKVHLGAISWTLGLNGLAIATDKLALVEANGSPFIISGQSEIGIAFLPLFQRRVIVKHVDFHHPEVFATQLAPGKWNFTDLMVQGPEIHFVEVDDGRLHLKNLVTDDQLKNSTVHTAFGNTKWKSYDFQHVQWKLIFPKKHQHRQWPFYLSFKLPRKGQFGNYTSELSLTVLANGTLDNWQSKKSSIEVKGTNIDPNDWRPFFQIPAGVTGLFGFHYKGEGIVSEMLKGDLTCDAKHLAIKNGAETILTAPEASCKAKMNVGPNEVGWDELKFDVAGLNLNSKGKISDWRQANPHYSAKVSADLRDLAELSDTSFWRLLPGANEKNKEKLAGAAIVEVNIDGDTNEQNIYTTLKAEDIPLGHLLSNGTGSGAPLLSMFQVEPNAPIRGQIELGKKKILLKDVAIPAKGSTLHIKGFIDGAANKHELDIDAADLGLNNFDTTQLDGNGQAPQANALCVTGRVDLKAALKKDGNRQVIAVSAKLKNAQVGIGTKEVLAKNLVGDVEFDGSNIKLSKISGVLADGDGRMGNFTLAGQLQTARNGTCALEFNGSKVDISRLVAFTKAAHIPIPSEAVEPIKGVAKELNIKLHGKTSGPDLALRLVADDNYYQFGPAKGQPLKPLHVTAGVINFANNVLDLKDLAVAGQTGRINLTAQFTGWQCNPQKIHVKSTGVDISEVQQYLNSSTMPQQSRDSFTALVQPLHLSAVQGKTYGELSVNLASANPVFDGLVGFSNVSGKVGPQNVAFDHLTGVVDASGNELLLQDLATNYGASRLFIQGSIRNYQTTPAWKLQVNGQGRPQDLTGLVSPGDRSNQLSFASDGPLEFKSTVNGDIASNVNKVWFYVKADANDNLKVNSTFGNFCQPASTPMTLDGNVVSDSGKRPSLQIDKAHLVIGSSALDASGTYYWATEADKPDFVNLSISTPDEVPAALAASLCGVDSVAYGISGNIHGDLSMVGAVDNMQSQGDVTLSHVAIGAANLKEMNGKVHVPHWAFTLTPSDTSKSDAQLNLSSLIFNGVPARDLNADLVLQNKDEPTITVTNGTASVADGKVTLNGSYATNSQKWHFELGLAKLQVNQFITDLIEHTGEITGLADGKIVLDSKGTTWSAAVPNLNGHGEIAIYKGSAPRVAQLQEKLTQANLLQQGIFGFNLNNVFQTVIPVKAGKFKEASVHFDINDGVVSLDRLKFDGNDLRLRAAGNWNMNLNTISVSVAGDIPRVASSILPGKVGEVSRKFTLQKAVSVVTFKKLESLPSVPILGDIGTDDPRAFTFKILASAAAPDAVTQSIAKTFHWLPNKPNASPHPVPGVNI